MKIVSWRSPEVLGEDETQPVLLEITLPQHPVNSVPQLWLVFSGECTQIALHDLATIREIAGQEEHVA